MTSNGAAPAPCDDRGEGRVADRLGGAISNLSSPSPHASQQLDLRRAFLASPLLTLRAFGGPRPKLFARKPREGCHTWGDELPAPAGDRPDFPTCLQRAAE
jgi:hypothetical protein